MPLENNSDISFNVDEIVGVDVYLEARKSRTYVGRLEKISKKKSGFRFFYDKKYLYSNRALPLGPDLPLTKNEFTSKELFSSFTDRIPSRDNPAFLDYCKKFGISQTETNPFVLLPTIARRGPSAFIFEPAIREQFSGSDVALFREKLGLTIRDFAIAFDIATATLQKVESGKSTGRDVLKRLEIYTRFPEVAMFELRRNQSKLHDDVRQRLIEIITK